MINVLPQEEKDILHKEYWMRFSSVVLSLLALTAVLAVILIMPSYLFSQTKESIAESRLEEFNKANPEIVKQDLGSTISGINEDLNLLSNEDKYANIGDKVFHEILLSKLSGITISQMLYNEGVENMGTLEIHGTAYDRTSLRALKSTIERNKNVSSIDLPISSFLGKSNINFTMKLSFK